MRHSALIVTISATGFAFAALAQTGPPDSDAAKPVLLSGAKESEDLPENAAPPEPVKPDPMQASPQAKKQEEKEELAAPGAPVKFSARSEDDLVLVDVMLGRQQLADSMPGYSNKGSLVLPLGQLSQALEFPITVSTRDGQANGWFMDRDNRFSLDISRHEIILGGSRESFDPALVELHKDDIYVDTTLLAKWFPLDFAFSFSNQTVTVSTRGGLLLPVQQEGARDKLHNQINRHDDAQDTTPLPKLDFPYQLYSAPFADVTYISGLRQNGNSGYTNDVNILANNDMLYMHSSLYLDADADHKLNDLRWTLSRRDPDGHIFSQDEANDSAFARTANDIGIREFAVGDVFTEQEQLTAFNQQGRGMMVSTIPYDRATQFDRTNLQGDLPAGWEVELYRNDELLDFQRASAGGRYEFLNVPLVSGLNIIKLVFYGPFGQKREETQRFMVSPNISEQGKGYWRFSVTQQDTGLVNLHNDGNIVIAPGVTGAEQDLARGATRALAEYQYGLMSNLSLFTSAAHLTTGDGVQRNYSDVGAATSLAGVYTRLDAAQDFTSQGHALELDAQDNLFGVSLTGEHQQFLNGFISDFTQDTTDPLTAATTLRADSPLDVSWLPHLNTGITALREIYTSGRTHYELGDRWSTAFGDIAVSHTLTLVDDKAATAAATKQTQGNLIVSMPVSSLILRSNVQYMMTPDISIDAVQLTSDYYIDRDTLTRFEIDRAMSSALATTANNNQSNGFFNGLFSTNGAQTTYAVSVNHKFDKYMLGANASHSSSLGNAVGFTVSLSIGEEPRNGDMKIYPDYSARDGMVSARAFHDANADGVFDEGDTPVEYAKFRVNNGTNNTATDATGTALLRNIPPDVHSRITLDTNSLDDPYLAPGKPGVDIVPRPGVPVIVDIPLVNTSDVEGTVYIVSSGEKKPAANVDIEVVDKKGNVVKTARSAFDGYYLIEMLPVGNYTIRVSPTQAERLNLHAGKAITLAVDGKKESIRPVNFVVRR